MVRPWKLPKKAISLSRPVAYRASLIAPSMASAPELPNETRRGASPGAIADSFSASATSSS